MTCVTCRIELHNGQTRPPHYMCINFYKHTTNYLYPNMSSHYFLEVAILILTGFYPWRQFCHNHLYVYKAIIARILAVMLWRMNSASSLKCNGSKFESSLSGYLDKGSV